MTTQPTTDHDVAADLAAAAPSSPEDARPSVRVIEAVAAATDENPLEMAPLYDAVDPDALDALLGDDAAVGVEFAYAGCEVAIGRDGAVAVEVVEE